MLHDCICGSQDSQDNFTSRAQGYAGARTDIGTCEFLDEQSIFGNSTAQLHDQHAQVMVQA